MWSNNKFMVLLLQLDILLPSSNPTSSCMSHSPHYEPYPCVIGVKLWVDRALVLGALRSHSARWVFWTLKCWGLTPVVISAGAFLLPKFCVRKVWSESLVGAEEHFHVVSATRRDAFGGIRWWGEWKSRRCRHALLGSSKILPSYLGLLLFMDVWWCLRLHFWS